MTTCATCETENADGRKFCANCGSPLAVGCATCGASNEPGARFCGECGTALAEGAPHVAAPASPTPGREPVAERRLVSVLFADLVGFTTLSETRDPEEVRELLSRYFETCRRLIEIYGGTVEKFIGDAVMAVWGTPIAQEDDAERAVRAALDLVAAVSALGDEVGAPELRARCGVQTGEAAVNLAMLGEGMVAGDLVNTAARVQAEAEPGTVLVGDSTRRTAEAAIVFEDAGEHSLKGKAEPIRLYRALRVAAARGGAQRSAGLEAPFVGRDRELRLVKELFHVAAEQSRAQLASIVGIGGIGKSRLAWEFEKYIDGLVENVWWHKGRCLAYGEGVAYWALGEMVRMRAGILEEDEQALARSKLAACAAQHLLDPEEREWVEPRLASLLGLEDRVDADRQDLFAAWRVFFERLADQGPLVLVFEDLQWADNALLAFIEYLLEWSNSQRLFVLALARPDIADRSPDFARSVRNAATLALEPLTDEAMAELLDGYVPGLPVDVRDQVLARAQGIPLYAVETVRMLLDRGLLVQEGAVYRPSGEITALEIPETLRALVAARLDGLTADERRLVQDGAVLGKTFTAAAMRALSGHDVGTLDGLLGSLVRKEVLSLNADPRHPELGQYGFLQELLRQVAYETLARRDRKSRHLAAVRVLEATLPGIEHEAPEVLATHLLAAYEAAPDDEDVAEIRDRARIALTLAAERAAAVAAPEEGQRLLDQAAALAVDDSPEQATLLARAGRLAYLGGDPGASRERLERAIAIFGQLGDTDGLARAGTAIADVDVAEGRFDEALERFESVVSTMEESGGPIEALAATLASVARLKTLRGDTDALDIVERALDLAEALAIDDTFESALITKSLVLLRAGRRRESEIVLRAMLDQTPDAGRWWRTANNLATLLLEADRYRESLEVCAEAAVRSRRRGDFEYLASMRLGDCLALFEIGRWDEALERLSEFPDLRGSLHTQSMTADLVALFVARGDLPRAEAVLESLSWARTTATDEFAASFHAAEACLFRGRGNHAEALAAATRGIAPIDKLGSANAYVKRSFAEAAEAQLAMGELEAAAETLSTMLSGLRPGELTPFHDGEGARLRALVESRREHSLPEDVDALFRHAEQVFDASALPFRLAVAQLEHAGWLRAQGRDDEADPLLAVARATFDGLGALPWLERADALSASAARALAD